MRTGTCCRLTPSPSGLPSPAFHPLAALRRLPCSLYILGPLHIPSSRPPPFAERATPPRISDIPLPLLFPSPLAPFPYSHFLQDSPWIRTRSPTSKPLIGASFSLFYYFRDPSASGVPLIPGVTAFPLNRLGVSAPVSRGVVKNASGSIAAPGVAPVVIGVGTGPEE